MWPQLDAAAPAGGVRDGHRIYGPVQRVAAKQGARRPAHHLDHARQFRVHLEQIVDVAEARWAQRNAVFEQQELAAGTRPGEDAGPNRSQVLLTGCACDPYPRNAHHDLVRMIGAGQADRVTSYGSNAGHRPLGYGKRCIRSNHDFLDHCRLLGAGLFGFRGCEACAQGQCQGRHSSEHGHVAGSSQNARVLSSGALVTRMSSSKSIVVRSAVS